MKNQGTTKDERTHHCCNLLVSISIKKWNNSFRMCLLTSESGAFQAFSPGDIETLITIAGNAASGIALAEIWHLGGVLARQPEESMAFNCRQAHFYLEVRTAAPSENQLEGGKRSIATIRKVLTPDMLGETLINFLADLSFSRFLLDTGAVVR